VKPNRQMIPMALDDKLACQNELNFNQFDTFCIARNGSWSSSPKI